MAHDSETELTRRIRTVESQPVLWRKHEVWSAIHDRIPPSKKRSRLYYYAAVLLILIFAHVYTLEENVPVSIPVTHREQAAVNTLDTPAADQLAEKPSEVIRHDGKERAQFLRGANDHRDGEHPVASPAVTELSQAGNESNQMPEAVQSELAPGMTDTSADAETRAKEPRIRAIVGVVGPAPDKVLDTRRQKRKLFHKLEPPEMQYEQTRSNTIVIARRK